MSETGADQFEAIEDAELVESAVVPEYVDAFEEVYQRSMLLLRDLEVINPERLISSLYRYLRVMTSDEGETLLSVIASHLEESYSWFYEAKQICDLHAMISELEAQLNVYQENDFRKILLSDCLSQIQFYQQRHPQELQDSIAQVYQAIQTCLDGEQLKQYKEEITNYLEEHAAPMLVRSPSNSLDRLLQISLVHALNSRVQQQKKTGIQFDMTAKKFIQFSENFKMSARFLLSDLLEISSELNSTNDHARLTQLESLLTVDAVNDLNQQRQQAFQFQAFRQLCKAYALKIEGIQQKVAQHLPQKVSQRLLGKMSQADLFSAETNDSVQAGLTHLKQWEEAYHVALNKIPARQQDIHQSNNQKEIAAWHQRFEELEFSIQRSRSLLETSEETLERVKLSLSCAVKAKECYLKFSPSLVFQDIVTQLSALATRLDNTLAVLQAELNWDNLDYSEERITTVQDQAHYMADLLGRELVAVESYLEIVSVDEEQRALAVASEWQMRLSHLLLSTDVKKLVHLRGQLARVERIKNVYMRALFILFFDRTEVRLSDTLVENIQSWHVRDVSEEVIIRTMRYFKIAISDSTLVKIAPHIKENRELMSANQQGFVAKCNDFIQHLAGAIDRFKRAS
jgi:hypothetical protein